ncbi:MAG: putative RiPP precursor [Rhizonema sp. PD37]|nr:putative RiPP precursor [Rhizonema sp. PD37]
MKKSYQAPKLSSYGTVGKLTEYSGNVAFNDYFFGDSTQTPGHGSVNVCTTNAGNCINPAASNPANRPSRP